jgi:hypothetical protein
MAAGENLSPQLRILALVRKGSNLTTLAGWLGADSRGPASLYLVSDSRITWFRDAGRGRRIVHGTWDNGRKTFASRAEAEIFGCAGDVLLPTQTIGQITDLIDSGAVSLPDENPERKLKWIMKSLENSCAAYPSSEGRDFTLLYGGRRGSGMSCSFFAFALEFKKGVANAETRLAIPESSGPLTYHDGEKRFAFGSGRDGFKKQWTRWNSSEIGGTSRSIFSAFTDHLRSGVDRYTGGPPQLVGIYRVGPAKTFGTIWNQRRFLSGMEAIDVSDERRLNWHNDLFELCNPLTMQLREKAQPQPRPKGI